MAGDTGMITGEGSSHMIRSCSAFVCMGARLRREVTTRKPGSDHGGHGDGSSTHKAEQKQNRMREGIPSEKRAQRALMTAAEPAVQNPARRPVSQNFDGARASGGSSAKLAARTGRQR
jgi:hypothetical protein